MKEPDVRTGPPPHGEQADQPQLLTLEDVLKFLRRRRWTILAITAGFFLLGMVYCAVATRRYQAEALIEIKRPEDSLGLNNLVQGASQSSGDVNPLEENVTLATKVAELQSETLGLRVIEELNLETTRDFKPRLSLNPLGLVNKLFSSPVKHDQPGTPFMSSPSRRVRAFTAFEAHLKVAVVPGTRLISIAYSSPDPDLAASVVNTLSTDLAQYSFQTRFKATEQLSTWLGSQIDSVRQQAEDMQRQESQLRRETETFNLSGTNAAGQAMVYSPLLDQLQQTTSALAQAESNRILRGAVEQIVQTGDPKLISGLAGSGLSGSGNPQSAESLDTIKTLLARQSEQQILVSQDQQRFGSANPKMIQEKAQLQTIEAALQAETDRLAQRAKNDYDISLQQEQRTRATHDGLIRKANIVNDKALQYEIVRQEAQDARQLYTDLDRRLHEAGVVAGLRSADMTVVSAGFAPDRPSSPKVPVVLPAAMLLGLVFGLVIAGIQDLRDDKVNTVNTVEAEMGLAVYAVLPDFTSVRVTSGKSRITFRRKAERGTAEKPEQNANPVNVIAEPDSQYAECLRALRTSILLSKSGSAAKTILVTSSTPGEGKSTTVANLGATFARTGTRTLLLEVDLRRPVLAQRLGLAPSRDGLSRVLAGQLPQDWVVPVPGVPNLSCIPAGLRPPDPYELLSSERMRQLLDYWKQHFDLILLDSPPVLPVIDSVLLSEQADLVLLVTRFGVTSINSLRTANRLLSRNQEVNLGVVMNAVKQGSEGYYEYYGYRNDSYTQEFAEEAL